MMEASSGSSDHCRSQWEENTGGSSRRYIANVSPSSFIEARLSAALEHFGVFRARGNRTGGDSLIAGRSRGHGPVEGKFRYALLGPENRRVCDSCSLFQSGKRERGQIEAFNGWQQQQGGDGDSGNVVPEVPFPSFSSPASASPVDSGNSNGESNASGCNKRDAPYQRYDIQ